MVFSTIPLQTANKEFPRLIRNVCQSATCTSLFVCATDLQKQLKTHQPDTPLHWVTFFSIPKYLVEIFFKNVSPKAQKCHNFLQWFVDKSKLWICHISAQEINQITYSTVHVIQCRSTDEYSSSLSCRKTQCLYCTYSLDPLKRERVTGIKKEKRNTRVTRT